MALLLTSFGRRVLCSLAVSLVVLGLISVAANADMSSTLRTTLLGVKSIDLRVDSFVLDKSEAMIGDTLRATVRVSNQGQSAATSTVLTFWAAYGSPTSTANGWRLATVQLGTLQPQAVLTSVNTFPVPNLGQLGTYQIFALVESSKAEANTQNNTQAKTLQIISPSFSDTATTPVSDSDSSSSPPASDPVASSDSSSPSAPDSGSGSTSSGTSAPTDSSGSSEPAAPTSDSGSSSPSAPVPTVTCHYYASPNGRGTGTTPESPFTIQQFWAVATPGKTLCLLNGIYQGASNRIAPGVDAPGLSGTNGKPITVRALNDGQALIDGQFTLEPVRLIGNQWFVLEGFNAKNGSRATVRVDGGSNNVVIRRVIAWDSHIAKNNHVLTVAFSGNLLVEDSAFFGTGGRVIHAAYGGGSTGPSGNVLRRVFARYEGSVSQVFNQSIMLNYSAHPAAKCENCIAMHTAESMPYEYDLTDTDGNVQSPVQHYTNHVIPNRWSMYTAGYGACTSVLGSLAFLVTTPGAGNWPDSGLSSRKGGCGTWQDVFVYFSPSYHSFNSIRPWIFNTSADDASGPKALNRVTAVASNALGPIVNGWTQTQVFTATSMAAVNAAGRNPWTTTTGANLCFRYMNGSRTNEPLWPWPMNERIKAATSAAGRPASPCPGHCAWPGGVRNTRVPFDLTAQVQALLGPIPAQCRND